MGLQNYSTIVHGGVSFFLAVKKNIHNNFVLNYLGGMVSDLHITEMGPWRLFLTCSFTFFLTAVSRSPKTDKSGATPFFGGGF